MVKYIIKPSPRTLTISIILYLPSSVQTYCRIIKFVHFYVNFWCGWMFSDWSRISQRGAPTPRAPNVLFDQFFSKNSMKMKNFWPRGPHPLRPIDPPMMLLTLKFPCFECDLEIDRKQTLYPKRKSLLHSLLKTLHFFHFQIFLGQNPSHQIRGNSTPN